METTYARLASSTMRRAKGLEFRAVEAMACDDEIAPLQKRIEAVTDDADLEEVVRRSAPVPVVLMRAFARPGTERKALSEGAAAFLAKPFGEEQLLAVLERLFGESSAR